MTVPVGLLGWVHRLKRVWVDGRWRVHRTSNGYTISSSITEMPQGTPTQDFFSHLRVACGDERTARSEREEALRREPGAIGGT
jgi:hypothetical protein